MAIPGRRVFDKFRILEREPLHDTDKPFSILAGPGSRITCLFLTDIRYPSAVVVMRGIKQDIPRKREQFPVHRFVKFTGIPVLKVSAAATVNQRRAPVNTRPSSK